MTRPVYTPLDGVSIIGTAELEDEAVTNAKLGANAVTSAKILNGTIVEADLATAVLSSAWANVSFASGWATPGSSSQRLRYKKIGNVVFLYGGMNRSGSSGTATMGTLPAGFRPPANFPVITFRDTDGAAQRVFVNADGTIVAQLTQTGEDRFVNAVFEAA